jgi:hypothetical protein
MKNIALKCAAMTLFAATAVSVTPPAFAAPEMYTAWVMCPNGTEIAVGVPIGQAPDPGICLRMGAVSTGPKVNPKVFDAISTTAMQPADGMIDVNQASPRVLGTIRGLSQEAAIALVKDRERAPFSNAEDMAVRLCSRSSIDLSSTDLRIGRITYSRNAETKAAGFKCTAGDGAYEIMGRKHNYVGHVTLLK